MAVPEVLRGRLTLPVIASPLFLASGPDLVVAQCAAGVVGSFPALNARPASQLKDWFQEIADGVAVASAAGAHVAPYAVNQIVHKSNDRLDQDMELCVEHRVPIVITSLGARPEINEAVHSYGGIVLHDVINDRFAHKAIEKGADGLIAVAAGAGGHAGTLSPFALVREIRTWFDGPLVLSGAIAHGRSILAALAAGADLAYVGSAFLATAESQTSAEYRQMIVDSSADDIVYSSLFTGVHGNYLRGSITRAGLDPEALPEADASVMNFGSDRLAGAKAWADIWGAGQGIGALSEVLPVAALVKRWQQEFAEAQQSLTATIAEGALAAQ